MVQFNSTAELLAVKSGCTAYQPALYGLPTYGYVPHLSLGVLFLILFTATCVAHIVQATYKRMWWMYLFVIGNITEIVGWGGRTWSAECPYNSVAFTMQISTLIIAPAFYSAGIYVLLGRFIRVVGREYSPLSPHAYLIIFYICDSVSLIVQAIGGGMASSATSKIPESSTKPGTYTMVGGIFAQLASLTVFCVLLAEVLRRVRGNHVKFTPRLRILIAATVFSVTVIYIRSIYRSIELLQGWTGYLITHERFFAILDGAMMVLASGVFNFIHPGWYGLDKIPKRGSETEVNETTELKQSSSRPGSFDENPAVRVEGYRDI